MQDLETDAQTKTAYRKAIRLCHPDKLSTAPVELKVLICALTLTPVTTPSTESNPEHHPEGPRFGRL